MPAPENPLKTAVLLCDHLPQSRALGHWLAKDVPGVAVHVVSDLCRRPQAIGQLVPASSALRLVLGLCSPEYPIGDVQAQARKAGLDALGVETVHLQPANPNADRPKLLMAAAVARARAFAGSTPEQAKLYLSARLSRRSLLRLSHPEYGAVPSIEASRCAAALGCQACVQVCPQDAQTWSDGQIDYDKEKCEPCGLCVTACPTGAIHHPALTPAQIAAQISTLLDPTIGHIQPRGIVFTCHRIPEPEKPWQAGWLPVRLPCVGMVPPAWFLAPLLLGAGAVGVLPCPGRCPLGQAQEIAGRVAYCRAFLQAIGAPVEMISLSPALNHTPQGEGNKVDLERPFDPAATVHVLMRLAQEYHAPHDVALTHAYSPLGVVDIWKAVCTGCGRCAMACPTQALDVARQDDCVTLSFDATHCTACGLCLPKCPEAASEAIALTRRTDLERLCQGRTSLYQTEMAPCVACGSPIAPDTMIQRIEALLGSEFAATLPTLTQYCPDCRGPAAFHDPAAQAH